MPPSKKNAPTKRMQWYDWGGSTSQSIFGLLYGLKELRKISPETLKKVGITTKEYAAIKSIQRKLSRINEQVTLGKLEVK